MEQFYKTMEKYKSLFVINIVLINYYIFPIEKFELNIYNEVSYTS